MQSFGNRHIAIAILAITHATLGIRSDPDGMLLEHFELENVRVVLKFPLAGTPWVPECRVDLEVVVGDNRKSVV